MDEVGRKRGSCVTRLSFSFAVKQSWETHYVMEGDLWICAIRCVPLARAESGASFPIVNTGEIFGKHSATNLGRELFGGERRLAART